MVRDLGQNNRPNTIYIYIYIVLEIELTSQRHPPDHLLSVNLLTEAHISPSVRIANTGLGAIRMFGEIKVLFLFLFLFFRTAFHVSGQ